MLVEFAIIPLGASTDFSDELARILVIVDDSGLPYQLTPAGTVVEGEWDDVMRLVHRCHLEARLRSTHVITTIRVEDDEGERGKLSRNVASVQEKLGGRKLRTEPH